MYIKIMFYGWKWILVSASERFRTEGSLLDWAKCKKDDLTEQLKNGAELWKMSRFFFL